VLPRRSEAPRRAEAEEDRDEALWRSAPRARAADAMVPWWDGGRRRVSSRGSCSTNCCARVVGCSGRAAAVVSWACTLMGMGKKRLRFDACTERQV
jgi:hypothetical protein